MLHFIQTYYYQCSFHAAQTKLLRIVSAHVDIIDPVVSDPTDSVTVHRLLIDFKLACDAVSETLSLNAVCPWHLGRLTTVCSNETYREVRTRKTFIPCFYGQIISYSEQFEIRKWFVVGLLFSVLS
jgi:hypothetical protein